VEKVVDQHVEEAYPSRNSNDSGRQTMKDYVNEYLAKNRKSPEYPVAPAMFFKRGGAMSVQASGGHYCSPKNDTGPYVMVEVLVMSPRLKVPKSFGKPQKNPDRKDKSRLFTWVPVDAVNAEIERRGGIANG
jgi:hypothetical protein